MGAGPNFGTPVSTTITSTPIPGCTDNTGTNTTFGAAGMTPINGQVWGACNYNATATVDDGSCDYTSCAGCTDPLYVEYDAVFTQPSPSAAIAAGYCTTLIVYGCTDATALNYDSTATVDDGSCITAIPGCMDDTLNNDGTYATNYNSLANVAGPCDPYNCPTIEIAQSLTNTTFKINTYNTPYPNTSTYWNGSGTVATIDGNGVTMNPWSGLSSSGGTVVGVKTSEPTMNYVAVGSTTVDVVFNVVTQDGNCSITETQTLTIGCTDSAADNATGFDISDNTQCEYSGCMDDTACNYNQLATTSNTSDPCLFCGDVSATNYDGASCNTGCVYGGCMDATPSTMNSLVLAASNFDASATASCGTNSDNECCTYHDDQDVSASVSGGPGFWMVQAFYEPESTGYTEAVMSSVVLGEAPGAMVSYSQFGAVSNMTSNLYDRLAVNFLPSEWETYVYNNNFRITTNADFNGVCDNGFLSDQLPTGSVSKTFNFSVGCKDDSTAVNFDPNVDLGLASTCIASNPGCTDPNATASSYDAAFNQDCNGDLGGTDHSCCCYTCDTPTFETNFLDINSSATAASGVPYATQVTFNFAAVSTAASYSISITDLASGAITYIGSGFPIPTFVPTSITNGVASYVHNNTAQNIFVDESSYTFNIIANCENVDGDSCGVSASDTEANFTINI